VRREGEGVKWRAVGVGGKAREAQMAVLSLIRES